jgi:hypothetical protein
MTSARQEEGYVTSSRQWPPLVVATQPGQEVQQLLQDVGLAEQEGKVGIVQIKV